MIRLLFICTAILLLVFSGCNDESPKKHLVGFSQCVMSDDWRQTMYDEVQRELIFHDDIELLFRDAGGNNKRQIQQIQELIDAGVELLIVSPNESEPLIPILSKAHDQGLPIILVDRKINSEVYTAFVGGNNHHIGREAAHYIAKLIGGKGRVLEAYEYFAISRRSEKDPLVIVIGYHEAFQLSR